MAKMTLFHLRDTIRDFHHGLQQRDIWYRLARNTIRMRYSRSTLGPWWVVIGQATWGIGVGVVWSLLFGMDPRESLPYMTAAVIIWTYFTATIISGCNVYVESKPILESIQIPYSVPIYKHVCLNLILLLYALPIFLVTAYFCSFKLTMISLLALPALALITAGLFVFSIIVAILGSRYRDVTHLMGNIFQLLFFLTPIFWKKEHLGSKQFIADLNPLYHFIEVVRAPMLNQFPPLASVFVVCAMIFLGMMIAIIFFTRYKGRIIYWI
jgi:ABC-type polysaccharide/polyol phosphate export permease